jgi:hypothetical protein
VRDEGRLPINRPRKYFDLQKNDDIVEIKEKPETSRIIKVPDIMGWKITGNRIIYEIRMRFFASLHFAQNDRHLFS